MSYIIKTEKLSVDYKNNRVLKDINIKINKNEITAIIGPSGCGKSTFLKTLNGLIYEEGDAKVGGRIFLQDKNMFDLNRELIREKIGMVFQNPTPFPISIYKNLDYGLKYYGVKRSERKNIIENKLKITGLHDEIKDSLNKSALKLSGGQQQRLCIARALTIEPEVLLLDEPCSALDVMNTMNIEKMLLSLKERYTIIIVTHNLSQAKRIADTTMFILNGEVIEYDKTEKLFNNPSDRRTKEYVSGLFG